MFTHRLTRLLTVVALVCFVAGCGDDGHTTGNGMDDHNSNDETNGDNGDEWDSDYVEVADVVQNTCALGGCHGETTGENTELDFGADGDDLSLETIRDVFETYEADSGRDFVVPGDAEESEFYVVVASDDPVERMPQGGDGLPDDQVDLIRDWIDDGASYE